MAAQRISCSKKTKLHGSANPQTTTTNLSTHREYQGAQNEELDRPFTQAELQAAFSRLTRNRSPGKDRVTNKHLRQLPPRALTPLLRYYKDCWIKGELPTAWKRSEVTMAPKPNKPISITNLRHISRTSCAGKLFEHMVNERLTTHLEENDRYPHTMFGFRQMLSPQDVLLQLKEDILDHLSKHSKSSILALHVKGAFDNVNHEAILRNLEDIGCGAKTYAYMRAFLTNRTATVGIANLCSKTFHLTNRDDITLRTRNASTGEQEARLQEAVNIIERYLNTCGFHCAPDKSELLILGACTRSRPPSHDAPDSQVLLQGVPIPKVDSLRVLGVHIHKDGPGSATLPRLHNTVAQLTHLIRRVANRRNGLKEHETLRMAQVLPYSRITYGTPYLNLKTAEKQKLNLLIRKATKLALG
ncbi:uncharacterized protein LOC142586314 [Dermacentor variabilis]|uniref:uncharacterized protein LOC142586314 n=1 Tax=Dermacentor variabilis TaxID=34621 RepID=UPI003F5CB002